jgi:tetratricopeptide (TPR) repeat protein
MKKHPLAIILILLTLVFSSICFSQNAKIDSLLNVIKVAKEDTSKVNALNNLFLEYEFSDDEKAKECLSKALTLSQKTGYKKGLAETYVFLGYFAEDKGNYSDALKNYFTSLKISETINNKEGIANAYNSIGNVYYSQGNYQDALKNHFACLKIMKSINNKSGIANSYNNIGNVYQQQDNFDDALKNHFASLKIMSAIGNKKGVSNSYNNIGNIYLNQANYSEALENYSASLKIDEELNNQKDMAATYSNIGIVYDDQGNYARALKNYFSALKISETISDKRGIAISRNNIGGVYTNQKNYPEALKHFFAGLKIYETIGDKTGGAMVYNNIGVVYHNQANYQEALKIHYTCLKIMEEIGNEGGVATSYANIANVYFDQAGQEQNQSLRADKLDNALKNHYTSVKIFEKNSDKVAAGGSYCNIGQILTQQKKYKEAEEYLIKAKKLLQEIGYKEFLRNTYKALTELDSTKGNYKGAYENHKLYILYSDSLDNEETRKKTIQSQMTYDFEKKEAVADAEHKKELENQKILAEEKSRKQKIVILFVICGLLLVLVFAGFIFRSLRTTRKQKNIIEQQKNVVEEQKREVELQKHLVEEHQKDIIDSINYAKRIQSSQLPTDIYIDKSLKRLNKA